jgi:hypothetical protein
VAVEVGGHGGNIAPAGVTAAHPSGVIWAATSIVASIGTRTATPLLGPCVRGIPLRDPRQRPRERHRLSDLGLEVVELRRTTAAAEHGGPAA